MKKLVFLSTFLLLSTTVLGASQERDPSYSGFSLAKGIKAAVVYALGGFASQTDAAPIETCTRQISTVVPDNFPMFMSYQGYVFDPQKIAFTHTIPGTSSYIVNLAFQGINDGLVFNFKGEEEANNFVDSIFFDNITPVNVTSPKRK